jgi:hypothetical protein
VSLGGNLYVCGDHRDSATFDGAILSGRRAAQALLEQPAVGSTSSKAPAALGAQV